MNISKENVRDTYQMLNNLCEYAVDNPKISIETLHYLQGMCATAMVLYLWG